MKKISLLFIILVISKLTFAQADTTKNWDFGGVTNLTTSQVALINWAAGGDNSLGVTSMLNIYLNYSKDKLVWNNTLDAAYGAQKIGKADFRKSEDKIDFSSKFGIETMNKWYYSGLLNFKTQFYDGFSYKDDGSKTAISGFMAPAYFLYSTGMDYKPTDFFAIYTSPLTGKTTYIKDTTIAKPESYGLDAGKNIRNEFGAYIKIEFNKEIFTNVTLNTKMDLFSNYLKNPKNIDITWNMLIAMKVNKYLTVNINTDFIYDDDTKVVVDAETGRTGSRPQFKEVFGVGFSYNF